MTGIAWLVLNPEGAVASVQQSRAQAARDVRVGNAAIPSDQISGSWRWRYEARRVPLDGSSVLGEALRTGVCVGCQNGRVPVEPKDSDG